VVDVFVLVGVGGGRDPGCLVLLFSGEPSPPKMAWRLMTWLILPEEKENAGSVVKR
jgi:hypothetical protein